VGLGFALLLVACSSTSTTMTNAPNCGAGTVEVNGKCEVAASSTAIANGDARASATTHWTGTIGAYTYQIAFFADHTGIYYSAHAPACPGSCHAPTPTACDDACVDTSTSPAHCGGCNFTCTAAQVCVAGDCVASPDGGGGPSSSPGSGSEEVPNGGSGTFTWSLLSGGGILNGRADGHPFKNLTNVSGSVGDANFSATVDGASAVHFTLGSGPVCQ
jgi:hypothetical protein